MVHLHAAFAAAAQLLGDLPVRRDRLGDPVAEQEVEGPLDGAGVAVRGPAPERRDDDALLLLQERQLDQPVDQLGGQAEVAQALSERAGVRPALRRVRDRRPLLLGREEGLVQPPAGQPDVQPQQGVLQGQVVPLRQQAVLPHVDVVVGLLRLLPVQHAPRQQRRAPAPGRRAEQVAPRVELPAPPHVQDDPAPDLRELLQRDLELDPVRVEQLVGDPELHEVVQEEERARVVGAAPARVELRARVRGQEDGLHRGGDARGRVRQGGAGGLGPRQVAQVRVPRGLPAALQGAPPLRDRPVQLPRRGGLVLLVQDAPQRHVAGQADPPAPLRQPPDPGVGRARRLLREGGQDLQQPGGADPELVEALGARGPVPGPRQQGQRPLEVLGQRLEVGGGPAPHHGPVHEVRLGGVAGHREGVLAHLPHVPRHHRAVAPLHRRVEQRREVPAGPPAPHAAPGGLQRPARRLQPRRPRLGQRPGPAQRPEQRLQRRPRRRHPPLGRRRRPRQVPRRAPPQRLQGRLHPVHCRQGGAGGRRRRRRCGGGARLPRRGPFAPPGSLCLCERDFWAEAAGPTGPLRGGGRL